MSHESTIKIDNLHRELESLAADGKWSELAAVLKRRDTLLSEVTNTDRHMTVKAVIQSNNHLLELALADRQAVARQLTTLRRSRDAAGRYQSHRQISEVPPDL